MKIKYQWAEKDASRNIIRVRMRWEKQVVRIGSVRNAENVLVGYSQRKESIRKKKT
jgi:hypothetical protein